MANGYRTAVNSSLLENLENQDSPNVTRVLFNREIANERPFKTSRGRLSIGNYLYDTLMLRLLLRSRSMHLTESTQETSIKDPQKSINIIEADALKASRKNVFWLYGMAFVFKDGEGYTCYNHEKGVFKEKYKIPVLKKWKEFDTWDLPSDHPIPGLNKKMGILLFTLADAGKSLNTYFLDTGGKYHDEIFLGTQIRYGEVLPSEETGKLIIPCMQATLPKHLIFDCILMDILDPRNCTRFQIKLSALAQKTKPTDVSCIDDLLIFNYKNYVEVWNLSSLLNNVEPYEGESLEATAVPITHVISSMVPGIILKAVGASSDLILGFSMYPPLPYFIAKGSVYDLDTQELVPVDGFQPLLRALQFDVILNEDTGGSVVFLDDSSSRVLFHHKNEFCVAYLRQNESESGRSSELIQEMYMKFEEEQATSDSMNGHATIRRKSSRECKRVKYTDDAEISNIISTSTNGHIGALVVMEVKSKPPNFKFHFFDSQSWRKILYFEPKDLPKLNIPTEDLADYTFQVNETEIVIGCNRGRNAAKLFVISLLDEKLLLNLNTT